jgi:hypothetical protein
MLGKPGGALVVLPIDAGDYPKTTTPVDHAKREKPADWLVAAVVERRKTDALEED